MISQKEAGFRRMDRLGLNHHMVYIAHDLSEANRSVRTCGFPCTIRTDRYYGVTKDLPFYLVENAKGYENIRKQIQDNFDSGMILLISNGRQYDVFLKYNMVFSVGYDGCFRAEYSTRNVPLRHMYRHRESLVNVTGHIDERYASWEVQNREHNQVDLREIRDLFYQIYVKIEEQHLRNRQIELSVYHVPCGTLHEPVIFWEI